MSIYKRGSVYWYKFIWNGEPVRESTKQGNDKIGSADGSSTPHELGQG